MCRCLTDIEMNIQVLSVLYFDSTVDITYFEGYCIISVSLIFQTVIFLGTEKNSPFLFWLMADLRTDIQLMEEHVILHRLSLTFTMNWKWKNK